MKTRRTTASANQNAMAAVDRIQAEISSSLRSGELHLRFIKRMTWAFLAWGLFCLGAGLILGRHL